MKPRGIQFLVQDMMKVDAHVKKVNLNAELASIQVVTVLACAAIGLWKRRAMTTILSPPIAKSMKMAHVPSHSILRGCE